MSKRGGGYRKRGTAALYSIYICMYVHAICHVLSYVLYWPTLWSQTVRDGAHGLVFVKMC